MFLKARAATAPLGSFFAGSVAILYLDVRKNLEPPTLVAAWMTIADGHRAVARTTKDHGKAEMIDRRRERYEKATMSEEEFELKLEVEPAGIAALLGAPPLSDDATDQAQDSVYFDTPDHELRKAGFSLRVRSIGERKIQTLKAQGAAAAGLFVRPEWERDIDGDTPMLLEGETPLPGTIPGLDLARIEPVFSVQVTRRTVLVERGNAVIEVVLDRGEIRSKDRSSPIHELEFELKKGDPASLFDLAYELGAIAPLRLGVLTKAERGYRLGSILVSEPVKTSPLTLQSDVTTKHGFQAIIGACLRQFRLNEAILIKTGNAGALHQARVSLRRLRSALSIFKSIVLDDQFDHIRTELRWIASTLGEARNIDVLLERLAAQTASKPLESARGRAYRDVQDALQSVRLRRLMLELSQWLAVGPWTVDAERQEAREQPLATFAAAALGKRRRRLKRLGRELKIGTDEKRHEARIEAKKLRYATEFFGSLFVSDKAIKRQASFHKHLAALQSHLGELNDIVTAPIVLAGLDLDGAETDSALQPDVSRRAPLTKKAAKAHEALMKKKRFWR